MRKSFDSLAGIVRDQMGADPQTAAIFIFFNRSRTHIKLLSWEGDGFSLYYKRLEKGTYEIPPLPDGGPSMAIPYQQLILILQGIRLRAVQYRNRYQQPVKGH
jgi:transposase